MDPELKQLFALLKTDQPITSVQLAAAVHLSEKTVRSRLKRLADELKEHGAQLIAKPGTGYQISIHDPSALNQWLAEAPQTPIPSTFSQRVDFLLEYLLDHPAYVKLEDLTQKIYVSRNTLSADLKQVESILHLYHLTINRRPNYGIRVEGDEFNRRLCLANCVYKNNMSFITNPLQKAEGQIIFEILSQIFRNHHIRISETSFENLIVHIVIANQRIQSGQPMIYSENARTEMRQLVGDKILTTAQAVCTALQKQFDIVYTEDEQYYIALHISGKASSDSQGKYGSNLVISAQIDELVLKMLNAVYEGMLLDFRDNLELRVSLNQHMVPLDIRMRYNIPLKNPILKQIQQQYAFAYTVAVCGCTALIDHYGKEVPEDEIAYLAVLFALAMEQRDRPVRRYNIVVVCVSGRGTSQLFLYNYKQAFGKYINRIIEATVFDLEELDFKGLAVDFVFTTVPLNISLPVPVYEISLLLSDKEINSYQRIFENGDDRFLNRYFDSRLFLPSVQAETKEQALAEICQAVTHSRSVPDDFYELVMKREEMGQTDFGNWVAIPHPCRILGSGKFVMAAILEKPIFWGHYEVQVIFLISLAEQDPDAEAFYRTITNYLSNVDLVEKTICCRTFACLMDCLKEAWRR